MNPKLKKTNPFSPKHKWPCSNLQKAWAWTTALTTTFSLSCFILERLSPTRNSVRNLSTSPCDHSSSNASPNHRSDYRADILWRFCRVQTSNLCNAVLTLVTGQSVLARGEAVMPSSPVTEVSKGCRGIHVSVLLPSHRWILRLLHGSLYLTKWNAVRTNPF